VEPGGQASQAASLVEALKEPTAHGAHVDPPYPGRHTQFSDCTVPVSSVVLFAPQAQQPWASAQPLPAVEALPTASLKVPCGHAAHAPLSSRKPALQRQELAAVPVAGCEFAGQAMQVASLVCPVNAEYVPAPQSEQASKDTVALYLPAAHETQLCESGPVWPAGHPGDIQSSGASLPAGELLPAGHSAQDTILLLMQLITDFHQTLFVYKSVVQPDRHPPSSPPKFQDNRFSQSWDSMSDGSK